jgi:hypothetical protein
MDCRKVVSVLVRRIGARSKAKCPQCGGASMRRLISRFAFHQSVLSKLDQLDPKYDKMIDAANPDLSFDNLVKRYGLDKPVPNSDS